MMQAMVFAAGLGTRLKPLTDKMPKALIKVDGEPLLKHVLLKIAEAGVSRVVVNVHHFAEDIKNCLIENGNFGLDVCVSDETGMLLETGGGIKHAASFFYKDEPILLHNVDILSNVNLAQFYSESSRYDAALLVSRRQTKRYLLFDGDMYLVAWINIETGEVRTPYPELKSMMVEGLKDGCVQELRNVRVSSLMHKEKEQNISLTTFTIPTFSFLQASIFRYLNLQPYAFSGIHVLSPSMLPLMDSYPDKFGIIDFYLKNCATSRIRGIVKDDLKLMDVGKLDTLAEADSFIRNLQTDK